jgi:putative oxidoreductase
MRAEGRRADQGRRRSTAVPTQLHRDRDERKTQVSTEAGLIFLAGRVLFGLYFAVVAGIGGHIRNSRMLEGYARSAGFPVAAIAGWPTGLWLVAGGLSVALGIWPDVGALMIAAFVVLGALYFHRFWEIEDQMQKLTQQQLFGRNVIALGTTLILFGVFTAFGPELRFTITQPLFDL